MPNVESVKVPINLLQRLAAYIESCPSGPHAAGVPMSLLTELEQVCRDGERIIDVTDDSGASAETKTKAAQARVIAEDATSDAVKAARVRARKKREREAKAAKSRSAKKKVKKKDRRK